MMDDNLVGIISDTHDHMRACNAATDVFIERGVGIVIHGGDFVAPFTFRPFSRLKCNFTAVFGNNDGERFGLRERFSALGQIHRAPYEFTHQGTRFLLLHEPDLLESLAAAGKFDVIIYGHTHEIDIRQGQPLIINPGEACGYLTERPTIAILDLESMDVEIVDLSI